MIVLTDNAGETDLVCCEREREPIRRSKHLTTVLAHDVKKIYNDPTIPRVCYLSINFDGRQLLSSSYVAHKRLLPLSVILVMPCGLSLFRPL